MRDMQTKFLERFDALGRRPKVDPEGAYEFDVVHRPGWSNTGKVYYQRGFHTVLEFSYSFQDTYASFHFRGPAVDQDPVLADNPPEYRYLKTGEGEGAFQLAWYALKYNSGDRVEAMFQLVDHLLDGQQMMGHA